MSGSRLLLLLAVLCAALGARSLKADYPIASHRYLADPSVLVTKDRVYAYCSNDDESPVEGSYNIPNVVCISSSDMKNWTDHGVVFDAKRDTTWAKKTWAPCVAERDGKYYLYFGNGGADIGVAVGDSPTGPFKDVRGSCLIGSKTPGVLPAEKMWLFDPAVFIDDDGQAYIYFGGNGDANVRAAKLKPDMISLDGEVIKMSAPNFFEASWMHKRDGIYYFSYSSNPKTGQRIDYMTGDQPLGDFKYRGSVAGQPPINRDNNHACEFEFQGKWYHIYHNRIVAKEAGIPTGFRRNIALEALEYEPDGAIRQVAYTTDGVPQVRLLNPRARVEAETLSAQSGIETEPCSGGGMNLTAIDPGDYVQVKGVDFGAQGARRFTASVASEAGDGVIRLHLDKPDGQLVGSCAVPKTGGMQSWKTVSCPVDRANGAHDLYLVFSGSNAPRFNLDWWQFD